MTLYKQFKRQFLATFVDACIVVNAYTLASLVLFSRWAPLEFYNELFLFLPIAVLVQCLANIRLGLYRAVGRYVGMNQALRLIQSVIVSTLILLLAGLFIINSSATHVVAMVPIGGLISLILMTGVRFYPRVFYERSLKEVAPSVNMLIAGAGSAGEMIIRSIQKEPNLSTEVVALVDDNPQLQGMEIHGVPIFTPCEKIPELVEKKRVDEIVIAIPSASLDEFRRIWQICSNTGVSTKTLRPLQSMSFGKVGMSDIRKIEIEDLLGRQPVHTDISQISEFIKGRVVLITGAGGSIGSELVIQISHHSPALIVLVDQDESALYSIHEKLSRNFFHNHVVCVSDIRSRDKMDNLFKRYRPNLVFHAAAYKHVPLMELQPDEAVTNNVSGTLNIATLAGEHEAACFVNISTDKAVEPVNVMGATKNLSERVVSELSKRYEATNYCSVRFGNVLGSRGSVIPIFREQIRKGGPITITHPDMTRYFMLISEAVDLVLQAASFPDRDEIYVLEMGNPVRIVDLAKQMVSFMRPGGGIEFIFTGLRPGEKLHEQLFDQNETREDSSHPMIYRVRSSPWDGEVIINRLQKMFKAAEQQDLQSIKQFLDEFIPAYRPFDMRLVGSVEGQLDDAGPSGEEDLPEIGSYDISYKWVDDRLTRRD